MTGDQQLRNVAALVREYSEAHDCFTRHDAKHNPRRYRHYAVDRETLRGAAAQLAEMVLEYLDAGGLDGEEPAGVVDDLPF